MNRPDGRLRAGPRPGGGQEGRRRRDGGARLQERPAKDTIHGLCVSGAAGAAPESRPRRGRRAPRGRPRRGTPRLGHAGETLVRNRDAARPQDLEDHLQPGLPPGPGPRLPPSADADASPASGRRPRRPKTPGGPPRCRSRSAARAGPCSRGTGPPATPTPARGPPAHRREEHAARARKSTISRFYSRTVDVEARGVGPTRWPLILSDGGSTVYIAGVCTDRRQRTWCAARIARRTRSAGNNPGTPRGPSSRRQAPSPPGGVGRGLRGDCERRRRTSALAVPAVPADGHQGPPARAGRGPTATPRPVAAAMTVTVASPAIIGASLSAGPASVESVAAV